MARRKQDLMRRFKPRPRSEGEEAARLSRAVGRAHEFWADSFLDRLFELLQQEVDIIGYLEVKGWKYEGGQSVRWTSAEGQG